ncbi:hypothetical protein HNQ94_003141 [Salirhabdus euzebyi]|uniref:Uncharacterized protein n=1 Tax=Salirhabdus euzebyi TaxID=394506 RepID=A0A841Q8P8_9BACI|nr:hypothetical protein [Salirhabdus euzebyi]MBB6454652.1 hypothetical protein [Salirhabdus euzebyi]
MHVCPLCNGLKVLQKNCQSCQQEMDDNGRLIDFFDDYSPYLEDEDAKLVDGYMNSKKEHICVHVFHCHSCHTEEKVEIKEQNWL